jgi:hypothetical protein
VQREGQEVGDVVSEAQLGDEQEVEQRGQVLVQLLHLVRLLQRRRSPAVATSPLLSDD